MNFKYALLLKKSEIPADVKVREGTIRQAHYKLVIREDVRSGQSLAKIIADINPDVKNGHLSIVGVKELDPNTNIHDYANNLRRNYFGEPTLTDMFTEELVFKGDDSLMSRMARMVMEEDFQMRG